MQVRTWCASLCCLGILLCLHAPAQAQANRFFSEEGGIAYLGFGVLRPLITEGRTGRLATLRSVDALAAGLALTEILKQTTHEQRPDHTTHDSFPSAHTVAAFTVAAIESHYHRREAPLWYLGATLIASSRISLDRHYFHDVLVGSVIGIAAAEIEQAQPRGFLLAPFVRPETQTTGAFVSVAF